jgi:hypothetical protein
MQLEAFVFPVLNLKNWTMTTAPAEASRKEAPRDLMQTDPIGQDNTQELL